MMVVQESYCRFNPQSVKTTAHVLRSWRQRARLSQRALAVKAGLDTITIYNAERGKKISDTSLLAILQALGKTVDDLERESRENGSSIIIEDDDGTPSAIPESLVREAELAATVSKKTLAEWVTLAISAYLRHPPTEASFS